MIQNKVVNPDFLPKRAREVRSVSKTVVMCYGTFDIYHPGHADLFEKAKETGDMLIVVVEEGSKLASSVYNREDRLYVIASHECVDYVTAARAEEIVELVRPEFVVTSHKGENPPHRKAPEMAHIVQEYGGKFMMMPRFRHVSAEQIAKNILMGGFYE